MPDPIRLLHFADTHIGIENYGKVDPSTGISSRVMDFLYRLNDICEYAEANEADVVIFAGDAFKSSTPSPTYQREFARRIKRLAARCPVILLVGNHDIPAMAQKASSIEIFHTLGVDNVIVGRGDRLHRIETRRGPLQVATVPYPVRQRLLADEAAGRGIGGIDLLLRERLDVIIRSLAAEVDPAVPAVLTGHFTVQGARLGSERSVMLGRDVAALTSTLADPAWDYVALGHIHFHQDMNQGHYPPVVYSGSIERIDFGEEGDPKGFCWVELLRGGTTYQFVTLPSRPFVTIRVDVRRLSDPMDEILRTVALYDVADAVVRVIITATPENEPLIRDRDIEKALEHGAFIAAIQREIDYPARTRLGVERPEGLSPLEMIDRYLISRDTGLERRRVLLEHARVIIDDQSAEDSEQALI